MRVSWIHRGGPSMASYRYRCEIPAKSLGASINDLSADVLIFVKPLEGTEDIDAYNEQIEGKKIIADFCDPHWDNFLYQWFLENADLITCSTPELQKQINRQSFVIPDTYEREEREPHCHGAALLWFGHAVNAESLRSLDIGYPITVVSNIAGALPSNMQSIPWAQYTLTEELRDADMVLIPKTADYKSPNRALEAIRAGCFVVAEPHPALKDFPIWQGNIKEGIEWAANHLSEANQMIKEAQQFIKLNYSPAIQANAWRTVLKGLDSTSAAGESAGHPLGSMSI